MMNPTFKVRTVKLPAPVGEVEHALIKCPRCLKGIGVNRGMLKGTESIICRGALGLTGTECGGHYYFDASTSALRFIGTV